MSLQKGLAFTGIRALLIRGRERSPKHRYLALAVAGLQAVRQVACSCVGDTGDNGSSEWRRDAKSYHQVQAKRPATFHWRSDARIIMGDDHDSLIRLWCEKRRNGAARISDNPMSSSAP